jgi:FixJ family two-component response regulator
MPLRGDSPQPLIAVIDDEAAVREATESLLRSAGLDVETYACAEDFLAAGCGARAACIVLDLHLTGMSGLELQRHLAAARSATSIVFMTAQDDRGAQAGSLALARGACAFLHKPFGARDLLGAVRRGISDYTKVQYRHRSGPHIVGSR